MKVLSAAVRKIESSKIFVKLRRPTKWPGSPTVAFVSDSQTPRTNGYAMNSASSAKVGKSSQNASASSRSRIRLLLAAGKALSACVDLAHFFSGPLHRFFGGHALHGLGIHVGDDVLRQHLGRLAVRRAGVARREAELGGDLEGRHHRILLPHLVLLPLRRRRRGVALLRDEPLLVIGRRVDPREEFL